MTESELEFYTIVQQHSISEEHCIKTYLSDLPWGDFVCEDLGSRLVKMGLIRKRIYTTQSGTIRPYWIMNTPTDIVRNRLK